MPLPLLSHSRRGVAGAALGVLTLALPAAGIASDATPAPGAGSPTSCRTPEERLPLGPPEAATPPRPTPVAALAAGSPGASEAGDYRHRLAPSPYGWVRLSAWCVWVEPVAAGADAAYQRDRLWMAAVQAALDRWAQAGVSVHRTDDPQAAQIRVWRRRPPLRPGPDGRLRASHGRAQLRLVAARTQGHRWLEPLVEVWIGQGQGARGLQATALHELGHAFGLWGHSDDPRDAMAAVPGPEPVLEPSQRDRSTLRWLQEQPSSVGEPLAEPPAPGGRR